MPNINLSIPSFAGMDLSDEKTLRKLTSYLYKLDEQLRYVLNNLGEDNLSDSLRTVINTGADATVINELTGKLQRLNTQIIQTAEAITLKASREDLDALGNTLNESVAEFELTAEQLRAEISDTASSTQSLIEQTASDIRSEVSDTETNLQSQIDQQAEQITLAVQTANSAASAADAAQATADGAQADADALGERVTKAEAEISVQATEISLRVTQTEYEAGLSGKLNVDAPSVGVNTGSGILINENGVYVEGKEIDLRTSDGDEYVNINEAGVSASSISAPDVMPRYDGPNWLWVNPAFTAAQLAEDQSRYRSLGDVFSVLSNKVIPYAVDIYLDAAAIVYEGCALNGAVLLNELRIRSWDTSNKGQINGWISFENCKGYILVENIGFNLSNGSRCVYGFGPDAHLDIKGCVFKGTSTSSGIGIETTKGFRGQIRNCEFYNFELSVKTNDLAYSVVEGCKGNCRVMTSQGLLSVSGTAPCDQTVFTYNSWYGGVVFEDNVSVNQGAGSSTAAVPAVSTLISYAAFTASYKGSGSSYRTEVGQGWYDGIGRVRGCMWFDNSTIRTALSGKTILSATLRLSMRSGVGRGTAVTVELCGTVANTGASSAAVTTSYGVIGTTSPGETTEITIPNGVITDLVNGTINGLMLYSSDTGAYKERSYSKNYAIFDGQDGADDVKPMLSVVYQG